MRSRSLGTLSVFALGLLACGGEDSGTDVIQLDLAPAYTAAGVVQISSPGRLQPELRPFVMELSQLSLSGVGILGQAVIQGGTVPLALDGSFDPDRARATFTGTTATVTSTAPEEVYGLGFSLVEPRASDGVASELTGYVASALGVQTRSASWSAVLAEDALALPAPAEESVALQSLGLGRQRVTVGAIDGPSLARILRYSVILDGAEATSLALSPNGPVSIDLDAVSGDLLVVRYLRNGAFGDAAFFRVP